MFLVLCLTVLVHVGLERTLLESLGTRLDEAKRNLPVLYFMFLFMTWNIAVLYKKYFEIYHLTDQEWFSMLLSGITYIEQQSL